MVDATTDAVDVLLEKASGMSDAERLEVVAGLCEQVDADRLPHSHSDRVRRWGDQARSAATAAGGPDVDVPVISFDEDKGDGDGG